MAVAIGALAVPRLIAAFELLPGSAAVALVQNGAMPSAAGLQRAVDAQISALATLPRPETHLDTALLILALIDARSMPAEDAAALRAAARDHLAKALRAAPSQARGWLMTAAIAQADGDRPAAARALAMSFTANPHFPALAVSRWPLALDLGEGLDRSTRERANLEFLSFFRLQPDAALALALRLDRLAELRALAGDDTLDRQKLDRAVERVRYDWAWTTS